MPCICLAIYQSNIGKNQYGFMNHLNDATQHLFYKGTTDVVSTYTMGYSLVEEESLLIRKVYHLSKFTVTSNKFLSSSE